MMLWVTRFNKMWGSIAPIFSFALINLGFINTEEYQAVAMGLGLLIDVLWRAFGPANTPMPGKAV
jgi:hypothetical protein